jgi:hypothetical protein
MKTVTLGAPDRHGMPWEYRRGGSHMEPAELVRKSNTTYLHSVLGGEKKLLYVSRDSLLTVKDREYPVPTASLQVQCAHMCFDGHVGIRLSPVLFMDIIVRELAQVIKDNPDRYAHLFTKKPGEKTNIEIRNDDVLHNPAAWKDAIEAFYLPLRAAITDETFDLFAPRFSTLTEEDGIAQLVALMDAASPFYSFTVNTLCGIPAFELDGDAADWTLLVSHVERLARVFTELGAYLRTLTHVLTRVAEIAAGNGDNYRDEEFWRSFYKFDHQSGGAYVDGWITTLFAHVLTDEGRKRKADDAFNLGQILRGYGMGYNVDKFPSGVSAVPFTWRVMGNETPMQFVAGALGIEQTLTQTLEARLGFAVAHA